jgi:hypothetical protein
MDKLKIFNIRKEHVGRTLKVRFLPNLFDAEYPVAYYSRKIKEKNSHRYFSYAFVDNVFCVFHYGQTVLQYFKICPSLFILKEAYYLNIDVNSQILEYDDSNIQHQDSDDLFYDYASSVEYFYLECNLGIDEKYRYLDTPENREYFEELTDSIEPEMKIEYLAEYYKKLYNPIPKTSTEGLYL